MFRKHGSLRGASILGAFLIALPLLGGCYLPSEDHICSAEELQYVENISPSHTVVDTLTPTISWSYPDPSCRPDYYEIRIYDQDIIRAPDEEHMHYPVTPIFSAETEELYYSLPARAGLQPGQFYELRIMPMLETALTRMSVITWFSTGPTCAEEESLIPPLLVYPPNGALVYFPYSVNLEWENQMSCWPAGDFYLQIAKTADFSDPIWYGITHNMEAIWIDNGPPMFEDCTRYYWRVRSDPAEGDEGAYSETWSFLMNRTEVMCPLGIGPIVLPPEVIVREPASCRSGPSLDYPILDYLSADEIAPIRGRNEQETWWYILSPNLQSHCWISGLLVDLNFDTSQLPVIPVDPPTVPIITDITDTPEPNAPNVPAFDCSQYNNNQNACVTTAGNYCKWEPNISPNSPCINR